MTEEQKIQHLYWRAGFGLSPNELKKKIKQPLDKVIKELFKGAKKINAVKLPYYTMPSQEEFKKMSKATRREKQKEVQALTPEVNFNWIRQMVSDDSSPLQEKMCLFWHGHFACESKRFDFAGRQLQTIRSYALGNFRDLVVAISKDGAMINYLNNQQNKKNKPNENYARELMELFTIGRGNYSEQDIKEAARAFTGWFADRLTGDFNFTARQHDTDDKTFMGKTGNWDGDDIVDIILEQKETATFIASKIYRYFVNEKINAAHVDILANAFYKSNYNIETMMLTLFESEWFYDKKNVGTKIKSPIELIVGMAKTLDMNFGNTKAAMFPQHALGQVLFRPPNVAGWPGGKVWIDNSTLLLRMNLAAIVFEKAEMSIQLKDQPEEMKGRKMKKLEVTGNIEPLARAFEKTAATELGQCMSDYLLQTPFKVEGSFMDKFAQQGSSTEDKVKVYALGLMSLPEYQMC